MTHMALVSGTKRLVPLPRDPRERMTFHVQDAQYGARLTSRGMAESFVVTRVNSRSFYVRTDGVVERYLRTDWNDWLRERFATGVVFLDGNPVRPPEGGRRRYASDTDPRHRDLRIVRAGREVLGAYLITETLQGEELRCFSVVRDDKSAAYDVIARRDWAGPPSCSCPDAQDITVRRNGGYCKHVIAVLLKTRDLRHQLLDLFL